MNFLVLLFTNSFAQQYSSDSTKSQHIQEVIVIGTTKISNKENKPLGSIDEYLQKSAKVNMIKRGAYAWEPLINGLPTERTLVTIDGMRIFGACTDKMDPVSIYVEPSNLSSIQVMHGASGTMNGSNIGGQINMQLKEPTFNCHSNILFALQRLENKCKQLK